MAMDTFLYPQSQTLVYNVSLTPLNEQFFTVHCLWLNILSKKTLDRGCQVNYDKNNIV